MPSTAGDETMLASARSLVQQGEQVVGVIRASRFQLSTLRRMRGAYLYFSFHTPLRAIVITDRRILVTTRDLYRRSILRRVVSEHPLSTPLDGGFTGGNAIVASEYLIKGLGGRLYVQEHDVTALNNLTKPRTGT